MKHWTASNSVGLWLWQVVREELAVLRRRIAMSVRCERQVPVTLTLGPMSNSAPFVLLSPATHRRLVTTYQELASGY